MALHVSDHALLRFLGSAAALDVESLRQHLAQSLLRAHHAAATIGAGDYLIKSDGLLFVVRGDTVTTVIDDINPGQAARALTQAGQADQSE